MSEAKMENKFNTKYINAIASTLESRENGIWFSRHSSKISYPETGNSHCMIIEQNSFWFNHRNNCITSVMRLFPPNGPIFDVGAGNGFVSLGIRGAGFSPVIVEPGVHGAMNAFSRGLSPVICSTLEDAGFLPKSIPSIGLFDVLEHIENDTRFLSLVRSLLIPGGRLYITVPAYQFLWSAEDNLAEHFRRHTLHNLSKKLQETGFIVEFQTYIFSFLLIPIFLFRTLPSKLGLRAVNRHKQYQKEHTKKPRLSNLIDWLLNKEIKAIKNASLIRFGGSCLIVAKSIS